MRVLQSIGLCTSLASVILSVLCTSVSGTVNKREVQIAAAVLNFLTGCIATINKTFFCKPNDTFFRLQCSISVFSGEYFDWSQYLWWKIQIRNGNWELQYFLVIYCFHNSRCFLSYDWIFLFVYRFRYLFSFLSFFMQWIWNTCNNQYMHSKFSNNVQ